MRAALCFLALALGLAACNRVAPGPAECSEFAQAFVGQSREDETVSPVALDAIEKMTNLCLTTPFDRQLIACAQRSEHVGQARACFNAYKQRTRVPLGSQTPD